MLAKKMTVLYKLAQGQLSRQYHYDFGLRALKAVLVMAGELKRGSPDLNDALSYQQLILCLLPVEPQLALPLKLTGIHYTVHT